VFDEGRPGELYFHQTQTSGNAATQLIAAAESSAHFDVMMFQECVDVGWLLERAGLADQYAGRQAFEGICLAFRKSNWALLTHGEAIVGEDRPQEFWGRRFAQWVRLRHLASGKVAMFVNHHGPLPLHTGGVCGGTATAHNLLQLIAQNSSPGDAVFLAGDFNAGRTSETVRTLETRLTKATAGTVHDGIDNVFTNLAPGAVLRTQNPNLQAGPVGRGGSDHDALQAFFMM
jgi:endonuclease/exonuclease/phosphatase family metal-dependent hydrolase